MRNLFGVLFVYRTGTNHVHRARRGVAVADALEPPEPPKKKSKGAKKARVEEEGDSD